ncbi:MAG: enoyl-CoA hydratase/isomerase family protein [Bacteroidia bacterium]|nr:enoyl-CoA hydratase/isomerase family protein [Bacteroidia bacterium]
MNYQNILTEKDKQVLTITINRPEKLNALNAQTISELGNAIAKAQDDDDVRVVILTGAGEKAFVAGADITEFAGLGAQQGSQLARAGQEVFNRFENSKKPVIAAINGFALGGGCELAMACHMRIAADNARFGQPEVKLGLIPGYGGTQRLVRYIGKAKAIELLVTADMITAADALQHGLVNYTVPLAELKNKCLELAQKIIQQAPLAVAACIACANVANDDTKKGLDTEIEAFGKCFGTADMIEGTQAFAEKRKPIFTGK